NSTWSIPIGNVDVLLLNVYDEFIALLVRNRITNEYVVLQYTLDGDQITSTVLPSSGEILESAFALDQQRFLLYSIRAINNGGTRFLEEYDIYDSITISRTIISSASQLLAGTVSTI